MTTLLVAGANGYLGSRVLTLLRDRFTIVALTRGSRQISAPIRHYIYDELKSGTEAPAFESPVVLLHVVGDGRERYPGSLLDSNVRSTELLLGLADRLQVDSVIYVSGFGVQSDSTSPYYCAKAAAEDLILRSGLPSTILQPSYILGQSDELTPRVLSEARAGVVHIPGDGRARIQPIHVDDFCEVVASVAVQSPGPSSCVPILGEAIGLGAFISRLALTANPGATFYHDDLAMLLRLAVFSVDAPYSTSHLEILNADRIGRATPEVAGVTLRSIQALIGSLAGG